MSKGLTFPYGSSEGDTGFFEVTKTDLDAVKSNLHALLVTNWGERPMHYDLGCNFKEFLFEQMSTDDLKQRMTDRVIDQCNKWMPFVVMSKLEFELNEDDPSLPLNALRVNMEFGLSYAPQNIASISVVIMGT